MSFDLCNIVKIKRSEAESSDSKEIELLEISMQSIAKRITYCKYHYQEFMRNSCDSALRQERLDSSFDGQSIRVIYEASVVAFAQNLHSLIDSFPYALNLIDKKYTNIDAQKIGWNKEFVERYKCFNYYSELKNLFGNCVFQKLKGLINRTKHKHLVRIKNTGSSLIFDNFSYYLNGEVSTVKEQNVNQFLTECYDILLPDFLNLCNAVEKSKVNYVQLDCGKK